MAWIIPSAKIKPSNLGIRDGKFSACPNAPNCVNSQSLKQAHKVKPISYQGQPTEVFETLVNLFNEESKATIVSQQDDYLHVEYRAFCFIDDVECYLPKDEKVIHIRSASRVGYSDFGANLRRVKAIRSSLSSRL